MITIAGARILFEKSKFGQLSQQEIKDLEEFLESKRKIVDNDYHHYLVQRESYLQAYNLLQAIKAKSYGSPR